MEKFRQQSDPNQTVLKPFPVGVIQTVHSKDLKSFHKEILNPIIRHGDAIISIIIGIAALSHF